MIPIYSTTVLYDEMADSSYLFSTVWGTHTLPSDVCRKETQASKDTYVSVKLSVWNIIARETHSNVTALPAYDMDKYKEKFVIYNQ